MIKKECFTSSFIVRMLQQRDEDIGVVLDFVHVVKEQFPDMYQEIKKLYLPYLANSIFLDMRSIQFKLEMETVWGAPYFSDKDKDFLRFLKDLRKTLPDIYEELKNFYPNIDEVI